MAETKCNCAHVVSLKGEPLGVITLSDICKYLVLQEAKLKIQQLSEDKQQGQPRHHHYLNRAGGLAHAHH